MTRPTILTKTELDGLAEIQRLLDEGLEHYLTYESHCKSSEGFVSVSLGNSWERRDGKNPVQVEVYSYVLGPNRSHYFDSVEEALANVREWHATEMAFVPEPDYQEKTDKLASDFLEKMGDRLTIIELNPDGTEKTND